MVQYVVFGLPCSCSWCVWWRNFKVNFPNLKDFSILLKSYFTFRAEELLQTMRNAYGSYGCYLLVINSKPKKGSMIEPGLPAPDPWLPWCHARNQYNSILAPSASTSALSSLTRDDGTNMKNNLSQRSAVEVISYEFHIHLFRVVTLCFIDRSKMILWMPDWESRPVGSL